MSIFVFATISRIENDHLLVPLTGPFAMKTTGVFAQRCVRKNNFKRCCDVEIKKLTNAVKELQHAKDKVTMAVAVSQKQIATLADEIKMFEAVIVTLVKTMAVAIKKFGKLDIANDKNKEHEQADGTLKAGLMDAQETIATLACAMKVLETTTLALQKKVIRPEPSMAPELQIESYLSPNDYIKTTIYKAAADLRLAHKTEALVQESCDADEDCIGYYRRSMDDDTVRYIKVVSGTGTVGVEWPIPQITWAKLRIPAMTAPKDSWSHSRVPQSGSSHRGS